MLCSGPLTSLLCRTLTDILSLRYEKSVLPDEHHQLFRGTIFCTQVWLCLAPASTTEFTTGFTRLGLLYYPRHWFFQTGPAKFFIAPPIMPKFGCAWLWLLLLDVPDYWQLPSCPNSGCNSAETHMVGAMMISCHPRVLDVHLPPILTLLLDFGIFVSMHDALPAPFLFR